MEQNKSKEEDIKSRNGSDLGKNSNSLKFKGSDKFVDIEFFHRAPSISLKSEELNSIKSDKFTYNIGSKYNFHFVKAEYFEGINGDLPLLKVSVLNNISKMDSSGVVDKTYKDPSDWRYTHEYRLKLTVMDSVYEMDVTRNSVVQERNLLTFEFSTVPMDFYFNPKVRAFASVTDAIRVLDPYPVKLFNPTPNMTPTEIHQAGYTDYRLLNRCLASLTAPSVYAYTMNKINITNLNPKNLNINSFIDIEKYNIAYEVEDRKYEYNTSKHVIIDPVRSELFHAGNRYLWSTQWTNFSVVSSEPCKNLLMHLVQNSRFMQSFNKIIRISTEVYLPIISGDLVKIKVPDTTFPNTFIVKDRLMTLGSECKFTYELAAIHLPN